MSSTNFCGILLFSNMRITFSFESPGVIGRQAEGERWGRSSCLTDQVENRVRFTPWALLTTRYHGNQLGFRRLCNCWVILNKAGVCFFFVSFCLSVCVLFFLFHFSFSFLLFFALLSFSFLPRPSIIMSWSFNSWALTESVQCLCALGCVGWSFVISTEEDCSLEEMYANTEIVV